MSDLRERIVDISRRRVGDILGNERNPKRPSDEKRQRLASVLRQYGKAGVLLTYTGDDGRERFFDGNTRRNLDPDDVWYIAKTDLTQAEVDGLVLMYDPLAAPDWDAELVKILAEVMPEEVTAVPDLAALVEEVMGAAGIAPEAPESKDAEPQTNRAEELRQEWGVEPGQMWRLPSRTPGQEHRLICGDCTDGAVVERLAQGVKFDMMFTDAPYGVNYEGGHFHSGDVNIKREREKLDGDTVDMYGRFLPVVIPYIDGPCYAWFADRGGKPVYDAIFESGCQVHAMLIWNKTNATYAAMNAQYKQRHEPCMYFKPKRSTLRWVGPTDECTVWDMPRDPINDLHPTQKPVHLAERAIKNHDVSTVADFFLGSGSTLIACENTARQCRAVEISPAYVAVALQRYLDAFGIRAELVE